MGNEMKVENLVSAGGVVFRRSKDDIEVVLCGRKSDDFWGLPKGGSEAGESIEETALREVCEETGLKPQLVSNIGTVNYWFSLPANNTKFHKSVHYYLMTEDGGSIDNHDWEHDRVEWFPLNEALKIITHKNDANILIAALDLIKNDAK